MVHGLSDLVDLEELDVAAIQVSGTPQLRT